MALVSFYFDDDCGDLRVFAGLRLAGADFLDSKANGTEGIADFDHLVEAARLGRVLVSSNVKDFFRIHAQFMKAGQQHAGIVLIIQQQFSVGEQLRALLRIAALDAGEMADRVEFLRPT